MDLPMMKYLIESMRNTSEALLDIMHEGKKFVCDECFGGNFETCEHDEPNAIRMMAGGKESWWCCGYCRLKRQKVILKSQMTDVYTILNSVFERHTDGTIRGTVTEIMQMMEHDVNEIQRAITLLQSTNRS